MALTNFPNGISSFGVPVYGSPLSNNQILTGPVLFVDTVNGVNAGPGTSPNAPYQTLVYAVSQATANSFIYVMAGSAIAVSSATALAVATAGLQIIGLGNGNARPTITLNTANTATIAVSAANVSFQNFIFIANFLSIAACFTLTTAKGFTLIGNDFRDTSSVLNFLAWVKSTGAANTVDNMQLIGNTANGLGTTSVTSFVVSANDIDGAIWRYNNVKLARTATAAVFATISAGVLTNLICEYNVGISQQTADTGGGFINVGGTTSNGIVRGNALGDLSTTDLFMTTTVGVTFINNYKTGVITASGYLLPAADS